MKIIFYVAEKPREYAHAEAFGAGVRVHGDDFEVKPIAGFTEAQAVETEIAVIVGLKGHSKRCMEAVSRAGRQVMLIDKGYTRVDGHGRKHVRVSVDGFQPYYFAAHQRPPDRWNKLGVAIKPRHDLGPKGRIVFAGSSQKYCNWHGLGDASDYAEGRIHHILKATKTLRKIIYRPKPSWAAGHPEEVRPVPWSIYSGPEQPFREILDRAHVIVTHGSNAAVEAVLAGVPILVLGDTPARALAETTLEKIENPRWPTDDERFRWACNMAYCQFTFDELASGEAWQILLERTAKKTITMSGGMTDAQCVIAQYRFLHRSPKMFRGGSIKNYVEDVAQFVATTRTRTLLDYGSGKGYQYSDLHLHDRWGGLLPTLYDPALPGIDKKPTDVFDGVICTDVLEHIPADHVEATLDEIFRFARKFVVLGVHTKPSRKHLPDGRNCHLTQRAPEWWETTVAAAAKRRNKGSQEPVEYTLGFRGEA